jgi:hypothetical protein
MVAHTAYTVYINYLNSYFPAPSIKDYVRGPNLSLRIKRKELGFKGKRKKTPTGTFKSKNVAGPSAAAAAAPSRKSSAAHQSRPTMSNFLHKSNAPTRFPSASLTTPAVLGRSYHRAMAAGVFDQLGQRLPASAVGRGDTNFGGSVSASRLFPPERDDGSSRFFGRPPAEPVDYYHAMNRTWENPESPPQDTDMFSRRPQTFQAFGQGSFGWTPAAGMATMAPGGNEDDDDETDEASYPRTWNFVTEMSRAKEMLRDYTDKVLASGSAAAIPDLNSSSSHSSLKSVTMEAAGRPPSNSDIDSSGDRRDDVEEEAAAPDPGAGGASAFPSSFLSLCKPPPVRLYLGSSADICADDLSGEVYNDDDEVFIIRDSASAPPQTAGDVSPTLSSTALILKEPTLVFTDEEREFITFVKDCRNRIVGKINNVYYNAEHRDELTTILMSRGRVKPSFQFMERVNRSIMASSLELVAEVLSLFDLSPRAKKILTAEKRLLRFLGGSGRLHSRQRRVHLRGAGQGDRFAHLLRRLPRRVRIGGDCAPHGGPLPQPVALGRERVLRVGIQRHHERNRQARWHRPTPHFPTYCGPPFLPAGRRASHRCQVVPRG